MTTKLAKRLKAARLETGLTTRAAALSLKNHVCHTYIHRLENGKARPPTPETLRLLCRVYGLNYIEMMELAGYLTRKELRAYTLTGLRMVERR